MNYAVIEIGGKQYIASPGKVISVDKLEKKEGDRYLFEKILLIKEGDDISFGAPFIEGAKVAGKILKQYKGKKIDVMKFKGKVRYRRKIGFRPYLTDIEIVSIKKS